MKPWKRKAVQYYGFWPLLGNPVKALEGPRVYWYQATFGDGIATWECPCGAEGHGFSITLCRLRLRWHLRKHKP